MQPGYDHSYYFIASFIDDHLRHHASLIGRFHPDFILTPPRPVHEKPVPVIVLAQLFGTSLWFSANSAADDLIRTWGIAPADIGTLTNAVQLGFILGTLSFAISGLADRFAASRIFAVCAVLGALCNAAFALFATDMSIGVPLRFAVGLCLAGVYPLGMKLVVSWCRNGPVPRSPNWSVC
jgi:MFS family permease